MDCICGVEYTAHGKGRFRRGRCAMLEGVNLPWCAIGTPNQECDMHNKCRIVGYGVLALLSMGLGGCAIPNSSNPTLSVTNARVAARGATLDLEITNPSEYDLILTGIEYTVVLGPLPVAQGLWTGAKELAMDSTVTITLPVIFDTPPLDPSAAELEFSGFMTFGEADRLGSMEIGEASFNETRRISR